MSNEDKDIVDAMKKSKELIEFLRLRSSDDTTKHLLDVIEMDTDRILNSKKRH